MNKREQELDRKASRAFDEAHATDEYRKVIADRVGDSKLGQELFEIEPRLDLLHEILGFGRFDDIYFDGQNYLGQAKGDIGYNHFLGAPSAVSLSRLKKQVSALSFDNKQTALQNPHVFRLYFGKGALFGVIA